MDKQKPKSAPRLDPAVERFIEKILALNAPPIYTLTPVEARAALSGAQPDPPSPIPADIVERTLTVGPTGITKIRVVRPAGAREKLPVIMYFHGGGWMLGDARTHDRLVRQLSIGARAAIVFVEYDRSPEAKYPVANEQAYAATLYVAQHAAEFNVDATRLAVIGDSAGGNMAAVVALMARQRGGPSIAAQVLYYPCVDADFETGSYDKFADGPWLTRPAMKWYWDNYLPDALARQQPTACPLRASLDELRGLPPALVVTVENDLLRDEGEAYAHRLAQADVPVTAVRYLGTIHDFLMLNPLADLPAARSAIDLSLATLRQAFEWAD